MDDAKDDNDADHHANAPTPAAAAYLASLRAELLGGKVASKPVVAPSAAVRPAPSFAKSAAAPISDPPAASSTVGEKSFLSKAARRKEKKLRLAAADGAGAAETSTAPAAPSIKKKKKKQKKVKR